MRLALAVGNPDVDAVLDSITWQQWLEWLAFENEFGIERGDDIATIVALVVQQLAGFGGKRIDLSTIAPRVHRKKPQTGSDLKRRCGMIARIHNAASEGFERDVL